MAKFGYFKRRDLTFKDAKEFFASDKIGNDHIGFRVTTDDGLSWDIVAKDEGLFNRWTVGLIPVEVGGVVYPEHIGCVPDYLTNDDTINPSPTDCAEGLNVLLSAHKVDLRDRWYFADSRPLVVTFNGGGLVGSGGGVAFRTIRDYYVLHPHTVKKATYHGFRIRAAKGYTGSGNALMHRAFLIGSSGGVATRVEWDASGVVLGDIGVDYANGIQVALGNGIIHKGTLDFFGMRGTDADVAAYGITCSGKNFRGDRIINRTDDGGEIIRHLVYWNGVASGCHFNEIIANRTSLQAFNSRAATGGGNNNGFGSLVANQCNLEPRTGNSSSVVGWSLVNGNEVGQSGAYFDTIRANGCGGRILNCFDYPSSKFGRIVVSNHQTAIRGSDDTSCPIVYIVRCNDTSLSSVTMEGYSLPTGRPIYIESCKNFMGGDISVSGTFLYGLHVSGGPSDIRCTFDGEYAAGINMTGAFGCRIEASLSGLYARAVRYAGDGDKSHVIVKPLSEPTLSLCEYVSSKLSNVTKRSEGYDYLSTTDVAKDVTGYSIVEYSVSSATTISSIPGGYAGQTTKFYSTNANLTLSHNTASGTELAANIDLKDSTSLSMVTRKPITLMRQPTSGAHRWLQV